MIAVVLLLMLIYGLQQPNARIRHERQIPWPYAFIAMGYIVFWAALRSGFVDTNAYIRMFKTAPTGLSNALNVFDSDVHDNGFRLLEILFKTYISTNYHYWLSFIAISTGYFIARTLRRHSPDFLFSMYLFITSTTMIWMFNGIRQFLVAAIIFASADLIVRQRFWKFFFILFLCTYIHGTSWIILPMYFFVTDRPFGKRMLLFIVAVLACAISVTPLMDSMEAVLKDTNYAHNLKQFAFDDGVNPLRVAFSCIPLVLALFKRRTIEQTNNKYLYMCINMSTIAAGLYFVGIFTSGIMIGRLPIYFSMFNFILLPYLFIKIYPDLKKMLYITIGLVYLVFYSLMANYYYISDILGNYV